MNATIRKIKRTNNGDRSIFIRLPGWVSFSLLVFVITGIVNIVIFVTSTRNDIQMLKDECRDNKIIHQAYVNAFYDLGVNIYKYLPGETIMNGGNAYNSFNKDAKHEEELTFNAQ